MTTSGQTDIQQSLIHQKRILRMPVGSNVDMHEHAKFDQNKPSGLRIMNIFTVSPRAEEPTDGLIKIIPVNVQTCKSCNMIFFLKLCSCVQFVPGQICTGVLFWPCERCLKNLQPGTNLHPCANLLLISRMMQIYTRMQIAHRCKMCTWTQKSLSSIYFGKGFLDNSSLFRNDPV